MSLKTEFKILIGQICCGLFLTVYYLYNLFTNFSLDAVTIILLIFALDLNIYKDYVFYKKRKQEFEKLKQKK